MRLKLWSCALVAGMSAQAIAQTAPPTLSIPADQALSANGVTARCMARTTTQSEHPNWSLVVPVPADKQAEFAAKGFAPASCAGLGAELARFKAQMCDLAKGNQAVQARTEQVMGVNARKICAAARALLPDTATTQSN